jgi:Cys-Gly metallodipeptidase DUG1
MTASAVFAYIDENQDLFIQRLKEVVAIKSVSAQAEFRGEVVRMGKWLETELLALGATVEMRNIGSQKLEGKLIDLPPVVLASYGNDPTKKTVLVYGHYDVQPALKEDGWKYDPFVLTEDNGRLFGRGSSDDKGPVICWLWVIQVYKNLNLDFPVNLKMCFEGMEESGSEGLDELVKAEAQNYFKNVDCICISDNYWLGTSKPCLTYGLRGVQTFQLAVTGPGRDLHSGVFGGQIHEPMTDLVHIMSKLVDTKGKILVPGIYDTVAPVTEAEQEIYKKIDFHMSDLHQAADAKNTIFETETESLMARWRFPTLSLHGNYVLTRY